MKHLVSQSLILIRVIFFKLGQDLRDLKDKTLSESLIDQICLLSVNWESATPMVNVTHAIDFGPGGYSGVGSLVSRNKEGTGVQVILAGTLAKGTSPDVLDKSRLFDRFSPVTFAPNWEVEHRPKLIRIASTNEVHIETAFSRLLGKPPLMVAGMTPCTANEQFVAAITNAGYHVELAGGGQHSEGMLRDRVDKLMSLIPNGEGISLNILFLNPRLWGFQYPTAVSMRQEGIPMEGVCVAAGVPSLDVAVEICDKLKQSGFRFIAFKAGSVETIRRVMAIAKAHPDFPVVLQWTGGRGGGHHSYEDVHQPMLETYGSIRRTKNIVLVIGSGFGDGQGTVPYLTGQWSEGFDCAKMPFDGILFGSRVMIAKENLASDDVKQLIASAPGIQNENLWERSYKGEIGGIITVQSELGEPIHKIANRGVRFWREMDDTIFSLPRNKRLEAILKRKDYIIERLNNDFQKPWFGRKQSGEACELNEMTYAEVVRRLFELLYVSHQSRWIDITYRNTFGDFLRRVEERFSTAVADSVFESYTWLDADPIPVFEAVLETFSEANKQVLNQEDVLYFITLCNVPGRKPVPFIPVFDEKFDFWFKKDSLWQSEDVHAVVGQDAERVAILQGPVAVRHCNTVNEPVKKILDDIYHTQISELKKIYYHDDETRIPAVEYLGSTSTSELSELTNVSISERIDGFEKTIMLELPSKVEDLPECNDYFAYLGRGKPSWANALLNLEYVVQDKRLVPNPIKRIMKPRANQTVFIGFNTDNSPTIYTVYDRRSIQSRIPEREPTVIITRKDDGLIYMTLREKNPVSESLLEFKFKYVPGQSQNYIHEITEVRPIDDREETNESKTFMLLFGIFKFLSPCLAMTNSKINT